MQAAIAAVAIIIVVAAVVTVAVVVCGRPLKITESIYIRNTLTNFH